MGPAPLLTSRFHLQGYGAGHSMSVMARTALPLAGLSPTVPPIRIWAPVAVLEGPSWTGPPARGPCKLYRQPSLRDPVNPWTSTHKGTCPGAGGLLLAHIAMVIIIIIFSKYMVLLHVQSTSQQLSRWHPYKHLVELCPYFRGGG